MSYWLVYSRSMTTARYASRSQVRRWMISKLEALSGAIGSTCRSGYVEDQVRKTCRLTANVALLLTRRHT